jgi:hypothetical protein
LTLTARPKLMTCYAHWPDIRAKPMARDKQKDTPTSDAANLPLTGRPKGSWPNHAICIHSAPMPGAATARLQRVRPPSCDVDNSSPPALAAMRADRNTSLPWRLLHASQEA